MAGQKFTLTFDAQLNVSQMNGALKQIQSTLNGLHLPQNVTRGLQGGIDKLQKEITNFESLASKDITSKADMSKLETQAQKVSDTFSQLRRSFANLTGLNGKDLEKLFPSNISKNIVDATKALNGYTKTLNDAKDAVRAQNTQVKDLKQSITDLQGKKTYTNTEWKQLQNDIKAAEAELEKYKQLKEQAEAKRDAKQAQLPATYKNSSIWRDAVKEVQNYESEIEQAQKKLDALNKAKVTGIKQEDQIKGLQKLNAELTTEEQKLQQLVQILQNLNSKNQGGGLQQLIQQVGQLTGLDMTQFKQSTEGVGEAIRVYLNQQLQQLGVNLNNAANSVNNIDHVFANNRSQVRDCAEAYEQFNMQAREVEQLKSRIQYFFSLNNAILLVKRTLREAYQTIKELDKAMTETAVVTDFSVGDMWAQLPDYTARANELGVTTKAAYEAATLFYQQGLKTNEVMAMSNETLKMARIAGLDAAVATDRMTNAIRGFNMEINEINAQRIDDVYSRLAAISASNVDEISTAMTKVASLAHNANMEFETTAAFLAQIIETTRESAETAGTALKTVVARFSEVKKLVDEGELSGKDEEGELINVNKVSEALHTAGIDLNKYFLGEIGLDDIFIELASKWDSLTTIQQRYIATQAAGSRQQSRFIALMSDYARTQELVGEAYNANGAAAKQFAKTQESLESKLARLKNAWNEFAMGIMNNDLVKAGVDLLTNILNGINALTSGFSQLNEGIGTTISSVSKLLMLFGVLGLGKTMLGGLTAGIANVGRVAAGQTLLNVPRAMATAAVGSNTTGALAGLANRGAGGALLAGFLNPLGGIANIGKTAWGGMKGIGRGIISNPGLIGDVGTKVASGLGTLGVSSGAAAGIMGISTALGTIALAIGAGVAAYQLWLNLTPEGKLKKATKEAENLQKTAKQAENDLNSLQSLESTYKEKNEQVNLATTAEDRKKAIQERNEAVLNAIKEDGSLAKYVVTEVVDNEITITINEDALANAITNAADALKTAEINSEFAEVRVSLEEAEKYKSDLLEWYRSYNINTEETDIQGKSLNQLYGELIDQIIEAGGGQKVIDKAIADATAAYQKYINSTGTAKGQAEVTYAKQLQGLTNDNELINQLVPFLGDLLVETGELLNTSTIESLINNLTSGNIDKNILNAAIIDSLDFSLLDIDLDSTEGFNNFLSQLGITEDELITFSKVIGDENGAIQDILKARSKELQSIQKSQKEAWQRVNTQTAGQVIQIGSNLGWGDNQIASSIADILSLESFDEQLAISDLLSSIDNSELAATVLDNLDNSGLREWIANLDFSNPINGLLQLQDAAKNGEGEIQKLGESLQETSSFSTSSLLTYFTQSSDYKSLTESLADFIDENGKISSSNIIELAKSNKTLNDLLKTGAISAKALAQALTGIETGKIQTWDLNDAIIKALNSMDDLDGMVKRTIDDLNNFDPGYDENDVASFITKVFGLSKENIEKGAYGNNQMRNYMEYLFGKYPGAPGDEYQDWLNNNLATLEANKDNMKAAWTEIAGSSADAAAEYSEGIKVWQENGEIVVDAAGHTTEELVSILSKETGATEQWMRMMIADYKNYSDDFALTLERNDLKDIVSVWAQEAGAQGWYLDKDLQTLATALGVDVGEINNILKELNPDLVKIDLGDGSPEDILGAIAKIQGVGGNVDLANRPSIDTSKLKAAGWLEAGEGTATVYSSTFSNENGTIAANFTPILPNGEVLSPTELQNYAESVISGAQTDDLKLQIGSSFNGDDAIEQAEQAAESIHQIQGLLYTDDLIDWNGIKQAFSDSGLVEYFDSTMNQMLEVGDSFIADFGRGLETVTIDAGETATSAYARAAEESARAALAGDIGEAVAKALGEIEINATTEEAQAAINELFGNLKTAYDTADTYSTSINISTDTAAKNIRDLASAYSGLARSIQAAATAGSGGVGGTSSASRARGGYVSSYGSGSYRVEPGMALTGEEDPEIVWNKEKGYAYITGKNGPEFQNLQPGDRVFNAQETKKILRNSSVAKGGIVPSYASRPVHGYGGVTTGGGSGGSGSDSDKYQKQSTWRNELDWLYDLMEDIAEYERQQNIIQTRNELALEDIASSGRDLYKLTREELTNLETQLDGQQAAQLKRLQQMGELQTQVNAAGYSRYMQWNQQDQTLEIDWDAIEAIQDKETYDEVVDWLNRMESVQDQIDDAEDAMWDIKKQIQELQQRYLQKYLDFQNRVLDAIVKQYQDQIDKLSEINDNVNDTNASILDSIQKEIDLERQIRDNTDAESNIADMEARLAYLQRDTTGANATEIRQLQKQLDEARTSYGDTLIDQAVDRLSQSNEDAAAQREKQIELMQAQLDYWQESGGLWSEVEQLISTGFNGNGSLIRGSDLEKVLQNAENYEAMSQAQRDNWANELILETNQVGAHILELANGMNVNAEQIRALLTNLTGRLGGTPVHSYTAEKAEEKYATGGLNTYTGLAHLDGTPSAPEYVLNPEQTNAFLRLADVLPSIMGGDSIGGTTYGGDIYLNLSMHVDEIASDYDVDRIADRVKDILYDASSYRNVNTLNFIR